MKTRFGFVSNSSTSSFVIQLRDITVQQIQDIHNHSQIAKELGMDNPEDFWPINETGTEIQGWTCMDNFSMHDFLRHIGVPAEVIEWNE